MVYLTFNLGSNMVFTFKRRIKKSTHGVMELSDKLAMTIPIALALITNMLIIALPTPTPLTLKEKF